MTGIDDVLRRVSTDPEFKAALLTDPRSVLDGYDLTADELVLLARQVDEEEGGQPAAVRRGRKAEAAFFALLSEPGDGNLTDESNPHGEERWT